MFSGKSSRRGIWSVFLIICASLASFFPLHTVFAENCFNKRFEWDYQEDRWTWSLSIPQSLYNTYKRVSVSERNRYGVAGYSFLVTTQDYYLTKVANKLHEAADEKGYGPYDEVSFILAFVQSLPYVSDSVSTKYDDYPRFPIETLVDDGGDCEDTSILLATLVLIVGYDAVFVSPSNHVAVGVWGKNLYGTHYEYHGKRYYYCETTGENWKIGDIPSEYLNISARLSSIDSHKQYAPSLGIPHIPGQENEPQVFPRSHWPVIIILTVVALSIAIVAIYTIFKLTRVHKVEEIVLKPAFSLAVLFAPP